MPATKNILAFDLGAESGRGLIGRFDGARLALDVVHRFPNGPVQTLDALHWDILALYQEMLAALRKTTLFAAGVASQRYMAALENEQEVMAELADMIAEVYALESALLRAQKLAEAKSTAADVAASMTGLLAEEALTVAEQAARRVLAACGTGDELRTQMAILRRLVKHDAADTIALGRVVAKRCVELERYPV